VPSSITRLVGKLKYSTALPMCPRAEDCAWRYRDRNRELLKQKLKG
jgi:hypothetical protein